MDTETHKRIERRAYAVWEAEGQPHGKHEEHWHFAARQIEAEESTPIPGKPKEKRVSGKSNGSGRKKSKK